MSSKRMYLVNEIFEIVEMVVPVVSKTYKAIRTTVFKALSKLKTVLNVVLVNFGREKRFFWIVAEKLSFAIVVDAFNFDNFNAVHAP